MTERLKGAVRRAGLPGLLLVGVLAIAFAACGGGDAGDRQRAVERDLFERSQPAAVATAEAHEDAEAHEGDDANAYLEVAPKDALFLVQMSSFAYTPGVLEVKVGEVVEIAIQNIDPMLHDFTIDKIDADLHISYLGGSGEHAHDGDTAMVMADPDLHFPLSEPGSGVVHIKVYEPGEYVFHCSVPGHRELGMVGTLIVR